MLSHGQLDVFRLSSKKLLDLFKAKKRIRPALSWFLSVLEVRTAATATATAAAPNLLEVFVDGNPVMVEPGTTVLQVTQ